MFIAAVRALILSDAPSTYRAMSVVRCLDVGGIDVFALSAGGSAAFWLSRRCKRSATCSPEDLAKADGAITNRINDLVVEWGIDVLVPVDLLSVLCASRTRGQLRCAVFPIPPPELFEVLNDKWAFTRLVRELGLLTPATVTLDQLAASERDFSGPLLIKPRAMEGGVGVRRVGSLTDALAVRSHIRKPIDWVVQEFVPGGDVDFSVLADDGRIIASTVERRSSPGRVEFTNESDTFAAGERIVTATKLSGAANIDMRRDARDGSLRIIECNPLLWDTVSAPVEFGLNFPVLGVFVALHVGLPKVPAVTAGTWLTPRRLVADLFDARRRNQISGASWASGRRVVADPLPWIYELFIERRTVRSARVDIDLGPLS